MQEPSQTPLFRKSKLTNCQIVESITIPSFDILYNCNQCIVPLFLFERKRPQKDLKDECRK